MVLPILLLIVILLPYANGANDTFKSVATLLAVELTTTALPVSTTHISCGTLFGIGAVTQQARVRTIATILSTWVTTLPTAAVPDAFGFRILSFV